jgi:hypothetical protein
LESRLRLLPGLGRQVAANSISDVVVVMVVMALLGVGMIHSFTLCGFFCGIVYCKDPEDDDHHILVSFMLMVL